MTMNKKRRLLVLPLSAFLFVFSCENDATETISALHQRDKVEWNYLIYMAADNNLERFALKNIDEIKNALNGSMNLNVIVLLDRSPGYDKTLGNWTGTKLFLLSNGENLDGDLIFDFGECDMTSPAVLENFLDFCEKYFPADKTLLDVWSHGKGVYPDCVFIQKEKPRNANIARSIMQDYTTGYDAEMSIRNFCCVLKAYCEKNRKRFDILQFDCCYMQSVEILWELENCADYVVASESELPANGSDYKKTVELLQTESQENYSVAENMVDSFMEKYGNAMISVSYSVIDMKKFANAKEKLKALFESLYFENNLEFSKLLNLRKDIHPFDSKYEEYVDLPRLLNKIAKEHSAMHPGQSNKFPDAICALENCIVKNITTKNYENVLFGMSVNFPYSEKLLNHYACESEKFRADEMLLVYKETYLDEIIEKAARASLDDFHSMSQL